MLETTKSLLAALLCLAFNFLFSWGPLALGYDTAMREVGIILSTAACAFFLTLVAVAIRRGTYS